MPLTEKDSRFCSCPHSPGLHMMAELAGSKCSRRQTAPLVAAEPAPQSASGRGRGGRGRGHGGAASSARGRGRGRGGRGRAPKPKAADELFHVQAIKAVREAGGCWQFLVSWEGYDELHDSLGA